MGKKSMVVMGGVAGEEETVVNEHAPKVPPPKLEFTMEPGQIMYIGNFHLQIESGKNFFGMKIPVGGMPTIKSEYDRDIRNFHEKYPQFKGQEITNNVLNDGPWLNEVHKEEELVIPTSH